MKLFEPIRIGPIKIKNRIAFAPTHMGEATSKGEVTSQVLCHYSARAKGGAGLIIVQVTLVTGKYAFAKGRGMVCLGERYLHGLRKLAEVIHMGGAKAVIQISIGNGAEALYSLPRRDLVAPSEVAITIDREALPKPLKKLGTMKGETARALTVEEIEELIQAAVKAAGIIKEAGFDGLEVHGAHGYLLSAFVSPLFNRRQDEYGGSFEKRLTLPLRIIDGIRREVGKRFVVGYRISGGEHLEGGLSLEESVQVAARLEKAGLDYMHVSQGCYPSLMSTFPDREGVILPVARAFKRVLGIPVICPNIHDPETAEKGLEDGTFDMASLSRGLIADPDWPRKVQEGRTGEINRCRFCYDCVKTGVFGGMPVRCSVNPEVGWERFLPKYFPEPKSRKKSSGRS